MPIYGRIWGPKNHSNNARPPQSVSIEVDSEEPVDLALDDDFEFIDESDLEGYAPGMTPDQGPSTRRYSRLPSWLGFTEQRGTPTAGPTEVAQVSTDTDKEPPVDSQGESSMSAKADPVSAAPVAEDEVTGKMLLDLRNEHAAAIGDLSLKIDNINLQLDSQTSALIHMQKYQQAYARDVRDLQKQNGKVNVQAGLPEDLYDMVKSQIQMLHFEVEKKVIKDFESSLDAQIAEYRKAYDSEIAELREIAALQADELRSLRDRLNQIPVRSVQAPTRAARSSVQEVLHDFPFGI